jgi:hypothetical protein
MAATPTPVTSVPTPPDLFGLQTFHLGLAGHRRLGIVSRRRQPPVFRKRLRQQRRRLRTGGERRSAGGKSKGDFDKVTAFHDIFLFMHGE